MSRTIREKRSRSIVREYLYDQSDRSQPEMVGQEFLDNPISSNVTEIEIANIDGLSELSQKLPENLQSLIIKNCYDFENLLVLPQNLKILELVSNPFLKNLPDLPDSLTTLDLKDSGIVKLPQNLPKNLSYFNLDGCIYLSEFPETIFIEFVKALRGSIISYYETELDLENFRNLTKLPARLSQKLQVVNLHGCKKLEELPHLPETILSLDLEDCYSLTKLPELPENLAELNLKNCGSLVEIENLPENLEFLDLAGCTNLISLPNQLPRELKYLDLSGCRNLPQNESIVRQLLDLEHANRDNPNFRLIWPEHFVKDAKSSEAISLLTEAYKRYYENDPELKNRQPNIRDVANYPVFVLFHRFLTEASESRGGFESINRDALQTIYLIAQKPKILKFLNESAKIYLAACINQPVAGFNEIAVLTKIAVQPDIRSKLETAKILIAIDKIKEAVSKMGITQGLEVELGNLMLVTVHKELLKSGLISQPWPGIPQGVAYTINVEPYMTEQNILPIIHKVKTILEEPLEKIAENICECQHQHFWAEVTLSEEEIKKATQEEKDIKERFLALDDQTNAEGIKLAEKIVELDKYSQELMLKMSKFKTLHYLNAIDFSQRPGNTFHCTEAIALCRLGLEKETNLVEV